MKIRIRTDGFRLTLPLPSALVCSRAGISLALCFLKRYVQVTGEGKKSLVQLARGCRKRYKGLRLVDVRTSRGESIQITL